MKLTWYDGVKRPAVARRAIDLNKWGIGVLFVGDKGHARWPTTAGTSCCPRTSSRTSSRPSRRSRRRSGHHQEWIHACKTGEPTLCNFDYSGMLVEHNLLGNVAFRVGKKLAVGRRRT